VWAEDCEGRRRRIRLGELEGGTAMVSGLVMAFGVSQSDDLSRTCLKFGKYGGIRTPASRGPRTKSKRLQKDTPTTSVSAQT